MSLFTHYILTFKSLCDKERGKYDTTGYGTGVTSTDRNHGYNKSMLDNLGLLSDHLDKLRRRRSGLFLGSDFEKADHAISQAIQDVAIAVIEDRQHKSWTAFKDKLLIRACPQDPLENFRLNRPDIQDLDAYQRGAAESREAFINEVLPLLYDTYKKRANQFVFEMPEIPVRADLLEPRAV